jgi:hypothetical protein
MLTLKQTTNGRWRVWPTIEAWDRMPKSEVAALLWRSYPTAQDAFAYACEMFQQPTNGE